MPSSRRSKAVRPIEGPLTRAPGRRKEAVVARKAAEPGYERWRRGYRQYRSRRNSFQQEVMQALKDAFDAAAGEPGDSLNLPNLSVHARLRRATLMRKFCMVLWSGGVAETVFRKYAEGADLAGFFTLLLWPN